MLFGGVSSRASTVLKKYKKKHKACEKEQLGIRVGVEAIAEPDMTCLRLLILMISL